ncbi:endolytic transglycosylase MltG [Dyella jiangningensis]|uniref:endolytic transglycosylase MltG n=1 Tax=Dyella jiangningensis TaxID=1379159 RepID=UPI00240EE12D|nr:endolytic transglycosylase MltG [Dyella jiangningensis]MDG2537674.1 endolytic transglycosylase MltG [Dyella jiangningensis]
MNRMKMRGRAFWRVLIVLVLLAVAGAVAYGWIDYQRFVRTPLNVSPQPSSVDVGKGSNLRDVVGLLREQHATSTGPLYWRVLAEQLRVAGRLHAGEYALTTGMTPRDLLLNMAAGKVLQRNFTIVDGWTFRDLRQALAKADKLRQDGASLDDAQLMTKIGAPGEMPEGRFLPETYAYVKGDSDLDILRRAHTAMAKMLDTLWAQRDKQVPLATPYDALILASIVEKETGRADERPRIAGVFVRRLQSHMLLQTDPTVIYGMGGSYAGNIHKSDLTTDTPYNTYTRQGLPPTPIAMPGKPAIEAALHPAQGTELYFVSRGDGSHVFSSSLDEHNRNVACYQLKHCQ